MAILVIIAIIVQIGILAPDHLILHCTFNHPDAMHCIHTAAAIAAIRRGNLTTTLWTARSVLLTGLSDGRGEAVFAEGVAALLEEVRVGEDV